MKELVDTEEDFARDMAYVVNNYVKEMENPSMPKRLRDFKDQLFANFKDISDFHNEYVWNSQNDAMKCIYGFSYRSQFIKFGIKNSSN